jgi:hypothetical protein
MIAVFTDLLMQLFVCVANTCAFSFRNGMTRRKSFELSLRFPNIKRSKKTGLTVRPQSWLLLALALVVRGV